MRCLLCCWSLLAQFLVQLPIQHSPRRKLPHTSPPTIVQLGFFSEHTLNLWPSCTRFYLVDLWGHQQNYEDIANVDQAEQEKRYQETRKRLEPWKDKVRWPAGPASTPAVLSRRLLP